MIRLAIHLGARALLVDPSLPLLDALWQAAPLGILSAPRVEAQAAVNALLHRQPLTTLDLTGDAAVRAVDALLLGLGVLPDPAARPTVPVGPPPSYPDLCAAAAERADAAILDREALLSDWRAA